MATYKALVEWVTPDFGKGLKWVKLEATDDKDAEKKARAAANSLFNRIARKDSKGKPDTDLIRLVKIKDKSPLSFMDSFVFFIEFAGERGRNTAAIQAQTESEAINKFKKTKYKNHKIIGIRKTGKALVMGGEQKRQKIGDNKPQTRDFMDSVVRAFKDRVEIIEK